MYVEGGELVIKRFDPPTLKLSVLLVNRPDGRTETIMAPEQVLSSIVYRLYYLDGIGLRHFKRVIDETRAPLETRVVVFKVDYNQ